MKPENKLRIQNILLIMGLSLIFGLLYNFFFYPHTFIEFLEAGSISVFLGFWIGILEEFVFKKAFHKISSLAVTVIRALLCSLLISTTIKSVQRLYGQNLIMMYLFAMVNKKKLLYNSLPIKEGRTTERLKIE